MKLYCRSLLSLLVILWTLEINTPVWATQDILMNGQYQYSLLPTSDINLQIAPEFFNLKDPETQSFETSLVIGEILAGSMFSLILAPVFVGIYVLGYDSDSSIRGPLGILGASALNAFSLASAITLTGNIDRERGDYWETWGTAMIGNAISVLLVLAVKGPNSKQTVVNELTTGLLISAALLIPLTCAVVGFNLSVDRKQASNILKRTQINDSGVSYQVLSF